VQRLAPSPPEGERGGVVFFACPGPVGPGLLKAALQALQGWLGGVWRELFVLTGRLGPYRFHWLRMGMKAAVVRRMPASLADTVVTSSRVMANGE
jgi:hypothetical protein